MTGVQIQRVRRALKLKVNNFSYIKMHLPTHIADCVRYMGSPDNFSTDISELLHIENIKEAYRASNRVDYEKQMLFWNEWILNLAYMDQTLKFLALQGYYVPDQASPLSAYSP